MQEATPADLIIFKNTKDRCRELRERKKKQTCNAIAETARAMFEQRGYDAVTVAEIADASNVSVKTL
jgi:AcrR family transcriptional regulator